MLLYHPVFS